MKKRLFCFVWIIVALSSITLAQDINFKFGDLYFGIPIGPGGGNTVYVTSAPDGDESYSSLTTVNIPSSVVYDGETYNVTSVGFWAFKNCTNLTSVTIPNSVTNIGEKAFCGCSSLVNVSIPENVTYIGYDAFSECSSLPVVDNLRYAGTYLVEAIDKSLSTYTIREGTTGIGAAFYECSNLTSVSIPDGVIVIGEKAFYRCLSLASVSIPNSVTTIGDGAFNWCIGLTSIALPEGLTNIGSSVFSYCVSLTSVNIPDKVTSIGNYAFYGCSSLTSVTIPNHVTYSTEQWGDYTVSFFTYDFNVGEYAFSECRSLTSVEFVDVSDELPAFDPETSFVNPGYIGKFAFSNCDSLSSITMPNGASVDANAFCECDNLASVTIPGTLYSIRDEVFRLCKKLVDVYVKSKTPITIYGFPFEYTNDSLVIHVPFGATEAYKSTKGWRSLNIQAWIPYSANARSTSTVLQFDVEDVEIQSCSIEGGESVAGNILEYIGLEPNSEYKDIPVILTSNTGETETIAVSFSTTALELTTQPSKPVSSTTAILMANTNMSDAEVSCGFEWKRNDAPADMDGTKVFCPVANGQMVGRLTNLKDDVYYKYRAFYQSAAGNMFYGEWQYIFTGDNAVEFEPIIYTYEATGVTENEATLKGYAIAGAEDFAEQGFEYWAESRVPHTDNTPARMPAALGEHHTVTATGILMHVTLTDLDEGTVYKYRTYAKTGGQTVYGSEMSFTTKGEYTGTEAIELVDSSSLQGGDKGRLILRNGQIFILRGDKVYTVTGQEVK